MIESLLKWCAAPVAGFGLLVVLPAWLAVSLTPGELGPPRAVFEPDTIVYARDFASRLPDDLDDLTVAERKAEFVDTLMPLILRTNETFRRDRARLIRLKDKREAGRRLAGWERSWLAQQSGFYETEPGDLDALLVHIDEIPPALVLAQAAIESQWGLSRFAQDANAVFGQWTWKKRGLVPQRRSAEKRHKVRAFDSLSSSVRAYMINLNTHPAYEDFRSLRAQLANEQIEKPGLHLAGGLTFYSERRAAYIAEIREIIRYNDFSRFNQAKLEPRRGLP